jgi:hypothetical protein
MNKTYIWNLRRGVFFIADRQSTRQEWPDAQEVQKQVPGLGILPPKERGLHARLHDHAQEAELGHAEGGPGAVDQ